MDRRIPRARPLPLPIGALLVAAVVGCAEAPAGMEDAAPSAAPPAAEPAAPAPTPISAAPPVACNLTGDSLTFHEDWLGTGLEVEELTPAGWDPTRHPTLIFLHGDNTAPGQYHCYRELLAGCCVRSIHPRQPTTARSKLEPLGWDQRFIRWTNLVAVYERVAAEQDADRIFIGGHSIGAYTAMLAAGARSEIDGQRAGNCAGGRCRSLPAAGYISISGWPARGSQRRRGPFWFPPDGFDELRPGRYVAYGTRDTSRTDPCLTRRPPACRGDAYEVDRDRAEELNLRLDVVEGFEHVSFLCDENWRRTHTHPAEIQAFVERLGDWIAETNTSSARAQGVSADDRNERRTSP